jgi:hypothetical protein
LLTESDLTPNGDGQHYFARDSAAARLVSYDAALAVTMVTQRASRWGEHRVATPYGDVVCHSGFQLYAEMCRRYTPEAVEAIRWIPSAQMRPLG